MNAGRVAAALVAVGLLLAVAAPVTRALGGELDAARARPPHAATLAEALLLTLVGTLWFGSLGPGGWWLLFPLLGLLADLPARLRDAAFRKHGGRLALASGASAARYLAAGALLALIL